MISEEGFDLARQFEPRIAAAFDSHDDESVGAKLVREANVFGLGTISGIGSGLVDKVLHPLGTVGELALGYTGARLISALESRAGFAGLVAQGVGLAVTYQFCNDVIGAGTSAGDIWKDTWHSSANVAENKAEIGQKFGGFLVDGAVTGYGAYRGAKAGFLSNQSKLITNEFFGGSTKDMGVVAVNPQGTSGSGFALDENYILTNKHIATNEEHGLGSFAEVHGSNGPIRGTVAAVHPDWDLALIKTDTPHGLKPLTLAQPGKELTSGTEVAALKRGFMGSLKVGPGPYEASGTNNELWGIVRQNLNSMQQMDSRLRSIIFRKMTPQFNAYSESEDRQVILSRLMGVGHGWSGSALIDRKSGEVVGVVSSGYYNPKTLRPTISESMQGVRELLSQVKDISGV